MTRCSELVDRYVSELASGFICRDLDDHRVLIATPYTYADGDLIEVIGDFAGARVALHDFGNALGRLELGGVNTDVGRFRTRFDQARRAFGVDQLEGILRIEGPVEESGQLLLRLIGALREVDVLRHLQPEPREPRFERRLLTHLRSQSANVDVHPTVVGRSHTKYRLTAAIPRDGERVYVQGVAGGRAESGVRAATHAFRAFADIDGAMSLRQKLVVLSKEDAGWRREDVTILSSVAYVAGWWNLERMDEFLAGEVPPDRMLFVPEMSPIFDE